MSRFLKEEYQKLEAYTPGEQPRNMEYIKLNTNESPYPPAPEVVAAVKPEDLENLRLYSDPTAKALKESIARVYGVKPEQIFVSNGSDEALSFAFMAFGHQGVLFPDITYGFYQVYAQLYDLDFEKIPLKEDFSLNPSDYQRKNKMVVIANPNAPTGKSILLEEIEQLLKTNPDNVVLIDEAYVDFGGETALPLLSRYENLLITRTFSKSRCLAGGRLGYAFGSEALIADLEKIKYSTNPYNLDRLTLTLGQATMEADAYYQEKCQQIIRTRQWTMEQLEKLGFVVIPSQANFLFAKTEKMNGGQLYEELKARGILVRHFTSPRIREYNRITIGTPEQMEVFITTVKEVLYENC